MRKKRTLLSVWQEREPVDVWYFGRGIDYGMKKFFTVLMIVCVHAMLTGCGKEESNLDFPALVIPVQEEAGINEPEKMPEDMKSFKEDEGEGSEENAADSETEKLEESDAEEEEPEIEEPFYNAEDFGYLENSEQHFYNEEDEEGYYYLSDNYFFSDKKYALVNQTLQQMYDEKEQEYDAACQQGIEGFQRDESIENEGQAVNFYDWYFIRLTYAGDDYISLLYNDVAYYAGAAHPLSYFTGITLDVETGNIVTPEDVLNQTWEEIFAEFKGNLDDEIVTYYEDEEVFNSEHAFYLTDRTLTYQYRTNVYVEPIVVMR